MGIMDRISRLVRANINDLVDKAEDPEKMLDQILRDMQSNMTTARSQVAAMIAQEKELEADLKETRTLALQWSAKAQRAVDAGKDDLAREALRRKRDSEENAKVYDQQFVAQRQMVEKLKIQLRQLEAKYQSTLSHRDALIARQRRAKAQTQVTQSLTQLSPLDPGNELARMERKIRSQEAQALALGEMASTSFDTQFAELDYDIEVEEELAALKLGSSSIDDELEALRAGGSDDIPEARSQALEAGRMGEQPAATEEVMPEAAPVESSRPPVSGGSEGRGASEPLDPDHDEVIVTRLDFDEQGRPRR